MRVESGGDALAIHDNTTGRTWHPRTREQAAAWARRLLVRGHSLDLGLMQVHASNVRRFGVDVDGAFEPCTNVRIGGTILAQDYVAAAAHWSAGQIALLHAISSFHHGSLALDRPYLARYYNMPPARVRFAYRVEPKATPTTKPTAKYARNYSRFRSATADDSVYRVASLNLVIR